MKKKLFCSQDVHRPNPPGVAARRQDEALVPRAGDAVAPRQCRTCAWNIDTVHYGEVA